VRRSCTTPPPRQSRTAPTRRLARPRCARCPDAAARASRPSLRTGRSRARRRARPACATRRRVRARAS
jgi:hypothetical protein